jgi:hypothetical protein
MVAAAGIAATSSTRDTMEAVMSQTQAERQAEYRANIMGTATDGRLLTGHTSPDTAYVVDDYPYGFRLRCQMRYWLEYRKGYGFRLMSQTSNPKKPGLVWNKPKASTYHVCAVMVLDDEQHVHLHTLSAGGWSEDETIQKYLYCYADALTDQHMAAIRYIRATNKASEVITVTVGPDDGTPRQTDEERAAVMRSALAYGYSQLDNHA